MTSPEALAMQAVLDTVLERLAALEERCDDLTQVALQSGLAIEQVSSHARALTEELNRGFETVGDELLMSHALNRRIAQLTDAVAEHLAFSVPPPPRA